MRLTAQQKNIRIERAGTAANMLHQPLITPLQLGASQRAISQKEARLEKKCGDDMFTTQEKARLHALRIFTENDSCISTLPHDLTAVNAVRK